MKRIIKTIAAVICLGIILSAPYTFYRIGYTEGHKDGMKAGIGLFKPVEPDTLNRIEWENEL